MKQKTKCPYCQSRQTVKRGLSPTKNRGKQQRYLCKDCRKTFIEDLGFWKMKNSEKTVTMSVDIYLSNLSSRKMRNQLRRHLETKISHVSVLDWVRKYVLKVHKFVDKLNPQLGGRFYADETELDCERRNDIFWCSVDWDTRFISGFHYSITRHMKEAVTFLKKATKKGLPKFIKTDAALFYPKAMHKAFSSIKVGKTGLGRNRLKVKHIRNNVQKTGRHNVRIETVFSKIKDRVDDFRGLKALWSAPILMAGIVLQHNFIEAHTTTGQVPCELAGLKLEAGVNRWLGLIKLACQISKEQPSAQPQ